MSLSIPYSPLLLTSLSSVYTAGMSDTDRTVRLGHATSAILQNHTTSKTPDLNKL